MLGAWLALFTVLSTTVALPLDMDPEALEVLESLKVRILSDLGMKSLPNLSSVNVSESHMKHMMRRYRRNVYMTETQEQYLSYKIHGKLREDGKLLFRPDLKKAASVRWAKLHCSNTSSLVSFEPMDVSSEVLQWHANRERELVLACKTCSCERALLEMHVRRRVKRVAPPCNRQCCRRSLKISFKDIGWNWIVQPVEFEAFYCRGRCRNVSDNFASTHALMQSILNYKGHKVAKPCCAPRKLRPLDLLHYNDKDPPELVVTRQKGMIVKECACT